VTHLPDFSSRTIVVIGDVMLDQYFWGDVERISPEAPVPVVKVNKKTTSLGGGGNVAMNLRGHIAAPPEARGFFIHLYHWYR